MKRNDSSLYREIVRKKNLSKRFLRSLCKKYRLSKAEVFGFISFSEEIFKKTDFYKKIK